MFVATIMDGKEQIYLITFGFGDGENDQPWNWLLTELRNMIGSPILDDYFKSSYKY